MKAELHTNASLVSGGDQQVFIDHRAAAPLGTLKDVTSQIETIVRAMPEVASVASMAELEALPYKRFPDPGESSLAYRLKFSAPKGRSADILSALSAGEDEKAKEAKRSILMTRALLVTYPVEKL